MRISIFMLNFLLLLSAMHSVNPQPVREVTEAAAGVAWQVDGAWQVNGEGAPVRDGDAIRTGSLLQPGQGGEHDSITILLPDGQCIVYECFNGKQCARAFRVPSLYLTPTPFATEMTERIRAALVYARSNGSAQSISSYESGLPRDEVVAEIGAGNRAQVAGLATALPNGHYFYDLRPLDRAHPRQPHVGFEKTARSITVVLPSAGLYELTIFDNLNTPRIDLFVAAVRPAQVASIAKSFHDARELMEDWDENGEGWPVHESLRAYLESLVLGLRPSRAGASAGPVRRAPRTGVTAEPVFSPGPSLLRQDTPIALRCSTPGATMHFTVDGSQPTDSSPVYRGPIMVRGTQLIIKSFASAPGKKDSAVVTGTFRIEEPLQ